MLNRIIHGDCLEVMKNIPDKSIDMILCDLPYAKTSNKWDFIIPFEELWDEYKRVVKENGAIVLTASQPFTTLLINSNIKQFKYSLVWEKNISSGFALANVKPMAIHEDICIFGKGKLVYHPQKTKGEPYTQKRKPVNDFGPNFQSITKRIDTVNKGDRYPTSVLKFNREVGLHPTQKPVPLFEYLIRTYSNEGETVLDNAIGSGTTAIACINTNRNFIGIEMDQGYVDIANKRILETKNIGGILK